jgi:predicted esterase
MKAIFSHGMESGPWGFKIKRLAPIAESHGWQVESIDYTDSKDPDLRAQRLIDRLSEEREPVILIGSSMGGYVSLVAAASHPPRGLFLFAPALYAPGYGVQQYAAIPNTEIVHGWSDDIVPVEHSLRYAREADCTLHLISGDHPLNDSIEVIEELFARFCKNSAQG